jgi:hypothetical protein
MNSRFLERFQRCRLRMGEPWFSASLGKSPAPAARANQEELDHTAAHPVANGCRLLAFAQFAKLRQSNEPG